jgi:hypothetical protein
LLSLARRRQLSPRSGGTVAYKYQVGCIQVLLRSDLDWVDTSFWVYTKETGIPLLAKEPVSYKPLYNGNITPSDSDNSIAVL